jgi:hypothetical protein
MMRRPLVAALICLVAGTPAAAQRPEPADLLKAMTVQIRVDNVSRHREALCQGFVAGVGGDAAFVVTAKHCIDDLATTPIAQAQSLDQLGVTIDVTYAGGTSGDVIQLAGAENSDVVVLRVAYTERPVAFADCGDCRVYRSFGSNQQIPVLSMLSAGGGPPVVSSGLLLSDRAGQYTVVLPSSPGTSGSAVIDTDGNLVGMVVSVAAARGAVAGSVSGVVPAGDIEDLLAYAVSQLGGGSGAAPNLPPAAPPTPPALAPSAARTWSGEWASRQGATRGSFTASLSQRGPTVIGSATFGGTACYPNLQLLGSVGAAASDGATTYSLTGYSDGVARLSLALTVAGNHLTGTYTALQSGTSCDGDNGVVSGAAE